MMLGHGIDSLLAQFVDDVQIGSIISPEEDELLRQRDMDRLLERSKFNPMHFSTLEGRQHTWERRMWAVLTGWEASSWGALTCKV